MSSEPPTGAPRSEIANQRVEIAGVPFACSLFRPSTPDCLSICKSPEHIDRYDEVLAELTRPRILEVGIAQGGSIAMLALLGDPRLLVAIDLTQEPVAALAAFLEDRSLTDRVRLHYGVDQSEQGRLTEIVDDELGGAPLDLVIDDASHLYEPTVATFEVLFPRLRPGGVYLIEDWSFHNVVAATIAGAMVDATTRQRQDLETRLAAPTSDSRDANQLPLSRIGVELLLALAVPNDRVSEVRVNENWILARRGAGALDPVGFRLGDLYTDHLGQVAS